MKLWLLKNLWIEKKFLFCLFTKFKDLKIPKEQISLIFNFSISFQFLIKDFLYFILCAKLHQCTFNQYFWVSHILISNSIGSSCIYLNQFILYSGIEILEFNQYNIHNGFTFLGWFYQYYNNTLYQQISEQNIQSHQFEIKRFLKTAGNSSIDFVILYINKKIKLWQQFYTLKAYSFKFEKRLNTYLFWRIWYFLKKRNKSKGIEWIRHKYYKKIKQKWILNMNHIKLITYQF